MNKHRYPGKLPRTINCRCSVKGLTDKMEVLTQQMIDFDHALANVEKKIAELVAKKAIQKARASQ